MGQPAVSNQDPSLGQPPPGGMTPPAPPPGPQDVSPGQQGGPSPGPLPPPGGGLPEELELILAGMHGMMQTQQQTLDVLGQIGQALSGLQPALMTINSGINDLQQEAQAETTIERDEDGQAVAKVKRGRRTPIKRDKTGKLKGA